MLDFYALRSEIKTSLLRRWGQLELTADPLVWAWIVHALNEEGTANNLLIEQALQQGKLWLATSEAWSSDGHLGSIGLLCSLLHQMENDTFERLKPQLVERIQGLRDRGHGKFSRLNDPDVVLGLALGVGSRLPGELCKWLAQHCERNALPGNWRRRLLFAASAHELHGNVLPFAINGSELQVHEVFPAVWFVERYSQLVEGAERQRRIWEAFERVKEGVSLEASSSSAAPLYVASPIDIAMLFEALVRQTQNIDPVTLFNNTPWHPEVRRVTESLFAKGEHVMAVFQAGVFFVDAVKRKGGHPTDKSGNPLDGAKLMSHVFGSRSPALKFNDLKTQADENEQRGLALMSEGIVSALRNPKGHVPHTSISLGPYEALEQLAIISYLLRRLDAAHP